MSCEIVSIQRTGSGYAVQCIQRDADEVPIAGTGFPIHIEQAGNPGGLDKGAQEAVDAAWKALEEQAFAQFSAIAEDPSALHDVIAQAADAVTRLKDTNDAIAAAEAQLATLEARISAKR